MEHQTNGPNWEIDSVTAEKIHHIFLVFVEASEVVPPSEQEDVSRASFLSSAKSKNDPKITGDEILQLCGMAFNGLGWPRWYSMKKLVECQSKLKQCGGGYQSMKFKKFLSLFSSFLSVPNEIFHAIIAMLYERIVVQVKFESWIGVDSHVLAMHS